MDKTFPRADGSGLGWFCVMMVSEKLQEGRLVDEHRGEHRSNLFFFC